MEIKCTTNVMCSSHPETVPPHPRSVEKLTSMKPIPGAEKIGTAGLEHKFLLKLNFHSKFIICLFDFFLCLVVFLSCWVLLFG